MTVIILTTACHYKNFLVILSNNYHLQTFNFNTYYAQKLALLHSRGNAVFLFCQTFLEIHTSCFTCSFFPLYYYCYFSFAQTHSCQKIHMYILFTFHTSYFHCENVNTTMALMSHTFDISHHRIVDDELKGMDKRACECMEERIIGAYVYMQIFIYTGLLLLLLFNLFVKKNVCMFAFICLFAYLLTCNCCYCC